jgi:hypothetical protein
VASKPSFSKPSGSKLQTTHLRLVPGEAEVFSASDKDKDGCWWLQNEVGSFLISQGLARKSPCKPRHAWTPRRLGQAPACYMIVPYCLAASKLADTSKITHDRLPPV